MANPLDDERIARGMAAQFELRKQRLASGETPIGWKAGFGAPAVLAKLKLEACLAGFMNDATKLDSGASVSLAVGETAVTTTYFAGLFCTGRSRTSSLTLALAAP